MTTDRCIELARHYLAEAQRLNEVEGMEGQMIFVLGCAVTKLIDHIDGRHDD